MDYTKVTEINDYSRIDKLNTLTNKKTFWKDVREFTKNIMNEHSIIRWQYLADHRYNELN